MMRKALSLLAASTALAACASNGASPSGVSEQTAIVAAAAEGPVAPPEAERPQIGTFGFDDEGVAAQRSPLVARGVVAGFLTSRETAVDGAGSGGAMRADGWGSMPLIRMTNVHLEPGQGSLDELVADTPDGLLLSVNRSWSIDDRRVNFQFGVEAEGLDDAGRHVALEVGRGIEVVAAAGAHAGLDLRQERAFALAHRGTRGTHAFDRRVDGGTVAQRQVHGL